VWDGLEDAADDYAWLDGVHELSHDFNDHINELIAICIPSVLPVLGLDSTIRSFRH
jgi:hypothetical protein